MRAHVRGRRLLSLLLGAGLLPFAGACGDAVSSTPSPEAIATAESVSREVTIDAPYSTTPEAGGDQADERIALDGRVFGHGPAGVILAHMRPADQTAWFPFATTLAATGRFTVLTFDFRGYGRSTGDKDFDHVDTDLAAAYTYMRDQLGLKNIFLVGASMGGTASLVLASRLPVAGVVSISSPAQFQTLDALGAVPSIRAPKLFITSKDDVPAERSQEEFWGAAAEPRDQHVYEGDAHGTDLFDGDAHDDLVRRIIAFLETGR